MRTFGGALMANEHYEKALDGLTCKLSSTAHIIHQVICYRYDTREFVKGKPNPGFRKSYPGMPTLMKATGKSRQACNDAIESLIANKIIDRVGIGRPGYQAEYRPIYVLGQLGEHVNLSLHVAKAYKSKKLAQDVNPAISSSKEPLPSVTSELDTISTTSIHKYDKYESEKDRLSTQPKTVVKVNDQRWHFISQDLDPYVRRKWQHSLESEQLLDTIETLPGWSLQRLQSDLGALNFANSHNNCGLLMTHLRGLAGSIKVPKIKPAEPLTVPSDLVELFSNSFSLPKEL